MLATVAELKARADLVSVVSRYVDLNRRGWARCPFHAERTPSFHVRPDLGLWKCFGCGEGGDVISFVMRVERCAFPEAVRRLDGGIGPTLTVRRAPPPKPPPTPRPWQTDPEAKVREFMDAPDSVPLWGRYRPLTEATIAAWQLGVGVIPASKCPHRRLAVPIRRDSKVVGLAGRAFECECPKWMYAGGSELSLFNLDFVGPGSTVIVVENYADAILACQEWPAYVTVAKGTADLWRPEWTEKLVKARPEFILMWPDNDTVGYAGAAKAANELSGAGLCARIWRWPASAAPKSDLGAYLMRQLEARDAA
jgi:DNA primase